ncbi:MAG: DUF1844 domain-containing protein [Myxococcota bacterium]
MGGQGGDVGEAERARAAAAADAAEERSAPGHAHVDFTTLVLSMSTNALVHMGEAPPEVFGGQPAPPANPPLAKQTIDLLAMLEDKTRGNLSGEEERILHQVLYDLRMRYVRLAG